MLNNQAKSDAISSSVQLVKTRHKGARSWKRHFSTIQATMEGYEMKNL